MIKTPKVYFTDTGLAAHLTRWLTPETLANGAMAGNIFENFVVGEILKSYYNAGRAPEMYYFRNTDGKEIDIVLYENGTLYPLEIEKKSNPTNSDIKAFDLLGAYFPSDKIETGGVICTSRELLPMASGNYVIPVEFI